MGDARLGLRGEVPDDAQGLAVGEQHVMGGGQCGVQVGDARCVPGLQVADHGRAERLVHCHPARDDVTEAVQHELHVVAEVRHRVAVHPAAGVLQRLRQVPVVQGGHRLDAPGAQPVHQAPVVVQALLVDGAGTVRHDPGPADREPVGVQPQPGHEIQVRVGPVVMIAGDRAGVAVRHRPRDVAERVPHGRPAAVFIGGPLDLVRGRGHAKQETWRKAHGHCRLLLHCASGMAMCGAVGTENVD